VEAGCLRSSHDDPLLAFTKELSVYPHIRRYLLPVVKLASTLRGARKNIYHLLYGILSYSLIEVDNNSLKNGIGTIYILNMYTIMFTV